MPTRSPMPPADIEIEKGEMMASKMPNSNDLSQSDEQLTAYLDGELSPSEAAALEQSLVGNEQLRLRLAELRRAYDFLDELPETPHNQRFTQSTLEHVIHDVQTSRKGQSGLLTETITTTVKGRWNFRFPALVLLVVLLSASFGAIARRKQFYDDLQQIDLAANLNGLAAIDGLDIAKELSKEVVAFKYIKDYYSQKLIASAPRDVSEKLTWFRSLSSVQQATIERDREELKKMNRSTFERYSAMEHQIDNAPNRIELEETIRLTGLVMDSLNNSEMLELEEQPAEVRLRLLRDHIYSAAANYYFTTKIEQHDADALKNWAENILHPALADMYRDRDAKLLPLIDRYFFNRYFSPNRGNPARASQEESFDEVVIDPLTSKLSDDARALLKGIKHENQLWFLVNSYSPAKRPTSEQFFVEFYGRIPSDRRESIDISDPEESRRQLEEWARRRFRPPDSPQGPPPPSPPKR